MLKHAEAIRIPPGNQSLCEAGRAAGGAVSPDNIGPEIYCQSRCSRPSVSSHKSRNALTACRERGRKNRHNR